MPFATSNETRSRTCWPARSRRTRRTAKRAYARACLQSSRSATGPSARAFGSGRRRRTAAALKPRRLPAQQTTLRGAGLRGAAGAGGQKVPVGGRQHLAIPTRYLRKCGERCHPGAAAPTRAAARECRRRRPVPSSPEGQPFRAWQRAKIRESEKGAGPGLHSVYQAANSGTLCLFVRLDSSRDIEPWYILTPSAEVNPGLARSKPSHESPRSALPATGKLRGGLSMRKACG